MPTSKPDPRDIVTEQAFRVEPSLLGTPLATPKRRLLAVTIDLAIAGILAQALGFWILIVIAVVSFRAASRVVAGEGGQFIQRLGLVALGTVLLSITLGMCVIDNFEAEEEGTDGSEVQATSETSTLQVDEALVRFCQLVHVSKDSSTGKEATAATSLLKKQIAQAQARAVCTEEPRTWTFFGAIRAFLDTMGITLGWVGAYFTLLTFFLDGQTPAKRWLGIRVVRLDGRPLNLWLCFERFSGYTAGLATGLLGFLQIYWDRNRQVIHDKIAATVVIRESRHIKN